MATTTKPDAATPPPPAPEKKKKVKAPAPVAPAAVGSASLCVRYAASRVFGLLPKAFQGLQPIWVTEPGAGKVTFTLDDCRRVLTTDDHDALLDAVQAEVDSLLGAGHAFEKSKVDEVAKSEWGVAAGELASYGGMLVEYKGDLLKSTVGVEVEIVGRVAPDPKKKPETMVLIAKAKRTLTIKFKVTGDQGDLAPIAEWDAATVATLLKSSIEIFVAAPLIDPVVAAIVAPAEIAALEEKVEAMHVDPFSVSGKVDYDKLTRDFGSQLLTPELTARLKKNVKGDLHRFLRRGIFFSHRDLDKILDCVEQKKGFYLYTGRGPSSTAMHLGHLVPFMMTQWLQEAFKVPLVVQMTDDEKFLWKGEYDEAKGGFDLDRFRGLTVENAKDIIASGLDFDRTFVFSDVDYMGHLYPNVLKIWKSVNYATARAAFGFTPQSNIGQSAFPAIQAAPSFPSSFDVPFSQLTDPQNMACLIPCAIDQDPYFRVTRDVAHRLVKNAKTHPLRGKPALIHSKFFPPLQGASGKMSSSDPNSAIFLTDSPEDIERKIMQHAFSGGRETAKEQRSRGADLDVDVSFQWLRFFLDDDAELEIIKEQYGTGTGDYWNTSAVKKRLVLLLQDLVAKHKIKRDKISDDDVRKWMQVRPLKPPPAI